MTIMKVTAVAPKAVSTGSVWRCVLNGYLEVEGKRDDVERWLVLGLGYRDGQPPSLGLPIQSEEWAALPLDGDRLLDKLRVYLLIEVNDKAPESAVN
jgi:hypothetical protein